MSPPTMAASTLPPRTGMRIRSSWTDQSTSNHAAKGERRPSRRSDHSGALRCVGCGTVMWLGTTSTMIPIPCSRQTSTRVSKPAWPPASAWIRVWSRTS